MLQAEVIENQGAGAGWCHDFNSTLSVGAEGSDVEALHNVLEKEGFAIDPEEKSNGKFDGSTASAVSGFQEKYKDEILTPLNFKYPTGFVGKATRTKLNQFYGCVKSLRLVYPNGAEKLVTKKTYNITWESTGIEKVSISILNGRDFSNGLKLGSFSASEGKYLWTIPPDFIDSRKVSNGWRSGDEFKISLTEERADGSVGTEDRSDNYFIITNAGVDNTCTDSDGGQNYTLKGYVSLPGYGWDYCNDANTLYEQDCGTDIDGNQIDGGRTVSYTCANGCNDGACKTVEKKTSNQMIDALQTAKETLERMSENLKNR